MTGRSIFRWRHWRKVRWAALAAAIPALWACNSRQLEQPTAIPQRVENNVFQETVNRDIDMLFMIDDSASMAPLIDKLTANFPSFTNYLKALPGGLPNVHIAVVSSDLGAGPETRIQFCAPNGQDAEFHDQITPGCTVANLGLAADQHFISNINGMPNYDPTLDISQVFGCIANLGDRGCGFEHQLQSVARALGADPAYPLPAKNSGTDPNGAPFLRPQAYLAIIMLTNEDDCSAPPSTGLFSPNQVHVTDQLGQLASYRCNRFGHVCGTPPVPPPSDMATADISPCHSAEDGQLLTISSLAQEIKALKADPSQIIVSVIGGLPTPYIVDLGAPLTAGDPMAPSIRHACTTAGTNPPEYADPGVRLADFVSAFGQNGLFLPICTDSFTPALTQIGTLIGKALAPKCITGTIAKNANGQDDCTIISHSFDQNNMQTDAVLPHWDEAQYPTLCPPPSIQNRAANPLATTASCQSSWNLVTDTMNCQGAQVLEVGRPMGPPPSNLNDTVSCAICTAGVVAPGCP
jgi:hypothetical protein